MKINPKSIAIITLIILLICTSIFVITKSTKPTKPTETNPPVTESIPTNVPVKFLTWTDPSGFVFHYPENVKINNHPEDNTNYANLTLTDSNYPEESIDIIMQDDTYKTLDKWIASDKNLREGNIIDTIIGGKQAKKILTKTQTIIGVIDTNVLVTIKRSATLSRSLETSWLKITDTFEFFYPSPTTSASKPVIDTSSSDDVLEEE